MKNIFLTFFIFLLYIGCSEEEQTNQETSIYGTWQLIEVFDGGSIEPNQSIKDGYFTTIKSNSEFSTTHQTIGCPIDYDVLDGNYQIYPDGELKVMDINIPCSARDDGAINPKYYFEIVDGFLILVPTPDVGGCFEGCHEKFKKIASEEIPTD